MNPLPLVRFAFGEIRHRRLRPAGNAFSYAGWFLRVPVHALDGRAHGSWLFGINRRALIGFRESDHGPLAQEGAAPQDVARATPAAPIGRWIDTMLRDAGIEADGERWLHAFPRVLGYAFKPVSFWYCHDRDGGLRAIVAEVHNTFGERHCYLLARPGGAPIGAGAALSAVKVFHVSPFCAVEGGYRFRFYTSDTRALMRIDYHDREGPLLLTSMSGRFAPVDTASCLRALLGHPWFSLGVIARIHWQALRLWVKRVPFHRKPSPPEGFVTRGIE